MDTIIIRHQDGLVGFEAPADFFGTVESQPRLVRIVMKRDVRFKSGITFRRGERLTAELVERDEDFDAHYVVERDGFKRAIPFAAAVEGF